MRCENIWTLFALKQMFEASSACESKLKTNKFHVSVTVYEAGGGKNSREQRRKNDMEQAVNFIFDLDYSENIHARTTQQQTVSRYKWILKSFYWGQEFSFYNLNNLLFHNHRNIVVS